MTAARYVSRRAASMSTAHFAISHWIPWKSAIVLPKAARCCTYSVAYMSAPSARPMPRAATIGRMALRPSMARRKPPTSPITFSAGTWTSVSTSSPVSTPRTPILWSVRPTSTPSQARSTMKAVTESWARLVGSLVLAKTVYQSASRTPDIQHLVPLRTQPPALPSSGTPGSACPSRRCRPGARRARRRPAGTRRRSRAGTASSAPRCRRSSPARSAGG